MSNTIIYITSNPLNKNILSYLCNTANHQELVILDDSLLEGPIGDQANTPLDIIRYHYWNQYTNKNNLQFDFNADEVKGNVSTIMDISSKLSNGLEAEIIYWMGSNPQDLLGYFFILHFLKKHYQRINIISIAGLPFLDDQMRLYFPQHIHEIKENQILKAFKLKRPLSPSEFEIDSIEWKRIKSENTPLRILDGNKKIKSVSIDYYDNLISQLYIENTKPSKIIQQIKQKHQIAISSQFINNRIESLFPTIEKGATE